MGKKKQPAEVQKISEHISLFDDGKYRWRYDLNLFKNPRIFFLVWKVLFIAIVIVFAFVIIIDIKNWGITQERLIYNLKFFAYFIIGMTLVSALGYVIYALKMGGKYCVIFEMDEDGINHRQIDSQAEIAKKIAKTTVIAGALTGNPTTIGIGINSARTEMYTEFKRVSKIKAYKNKELIKLTEKLSHNQVYVFKEDFDFVESFITSHCENL